MIRTMLAAMMLAVVAIAGASASQTATSPTCTEGRPHLVSYRFVVGNVTHDHLAGVTHAGDNVTILFTLDSCDGTFREGSLALTLPTCASPLRTVALHALEDVDRSNASNEVERALVRDVRDGMGCNETQMLARVAPFAPFTVGALAALAAGVFILLRRKDL